MVRKIGIAVLALSIAVAFSAIAMAAAPAGEIEIGKGAGVAAGKKGQVKFTHESHKDLKCVDCHHEAKDAAAEAAIKSCFSCHGKDPNAKGDITSGKASENPFHKNCVTDCHKAKGKGPTKCAECHGGSE